MKHLLTCFVAGVLTGPAMAQDPRMDPTQLDPSGKYQPAHSDPPAPAAEGLKVEPLGHGKFRLGQIEIDATKRQLSFPVALAETQSPLEYALVHSAGKAHESLLITDVHPTHLHIAALLLSVKPGTPLHAQVSWDVNGPPQSINLTELIHITATDSKPVTWTYQALTLVDGKLAAASELSLLSLINDPSALATHQLLAEDLRDDIYRAQLPQTFPAKGLPLTLVLSFPSPRKQTISAASK